jgi:hypothetical protein
MPLNLFCRDKHGKSKIIPTPSGFSENWAFSCKPKNQGFGKIVGILQHHLTKTGFFRQKNSY